jgi:hypothetical protein
VYAAVGVTGVGCGMQVEGAAPEQLRFTGLAYPFFAVSVPLKVAVWVGNTVCGEFTMEFA